MPVIVMARGLVSSPSTIPPWNWKTLCSCSGFALTHSKYSTQRVHISDGVSKMGSRLGFTGTQNVMMFSFPPTYAAAPLLARFRNRPERPQEYKSSHQTGQEDQ